MIDLDSSPTKLLQVVRIGKQLLMTRGALTTFSIANDVAKYFAVIPVLFYGIYPELAQLNVMQLGSHYRCFDSISSKRSQIQRKTSQPNFAPQFTGIWTRRIDRTFHFYQIDRYRAKLFPTMNKLKEGCRNEKDSRDSIAFLGV